MNDFLDFIQQVKRANDIVDVVGSYLELRQRGTNYFARCPFHGEKTASFSVNRNKQIFKCFGCGESGDVIKFVQMYESCTLVEAVEILAKRAGLKMPETYEQKQDKDFAEKKKKKDIYLAICHDVAVFYYKNYYASQGQKARDYMTKRGFDAETVKKFGIGYSPDMYSLPKYLRSKGYSVDDCLKCGVLQTRQNGGEAFDALSGRLIVPIFNMSGKVIAFGGRGLDEATIAFGKYKNTSDTPLFSKRDNLFAMNIAKEQKQQAALHNIVVVEGYMDVIAMYQAGFKRTLASMGTSLTENQAKLLSRLTESVYICYDGDAAGQRATIRGMDILDHAGLEVKVMSVPENLDPDEYIKKYGAEAFEALVTQALPLPEYKLTVLKRAFPIENVDIVTRNNNLPKFVNGAVKMLKQLDDVRQESYLQTISVQTGYSQEHLRRKIAQSDEDASEVVDTNVLTPENKAKYFVAACLLNNMDFATLSEKPYCQTKFLSDLFDYILNCKAQHQEPKLDMLYSICPDATQEEYAQIINVDLSDSRKEKNAAYYKDCKRLLMVEKIKQQREELLQKLKKEPDNPDLLAQIAQLSSKINV